MSDCNGNSSNKHPPGKGSNEEGHVMGRGRGRGHVDDYGQRASTTDEELAKRSGSEQEQQQSEMTKRGKMREGRLMADLLKTRPKDLASKQGKEGNEVQLLTNHFRVNFDYNFQVHHYNIAFEPQTELVRVRNHILRHIEEELGSFIYDGMNIIYLTRHPPAEVMLSQARDGTQYRVLLRNTNTPIEFTEAMGLMVLNTILRRAMEGLNLQQVQRNLFDPRAPIELPEFRLQLWPGYVTSIRQYERDVLVCCEISHKVMRQETVLDVLAHAGQNNPNYRDVASKEIINTIVLTGYNNQTYSIVSIAWDMNPMSTFDTPNGPISFIQYYQTKHQLTIRDRRQPLLIARLSARDIRGGRTSPPILVPELCRTTGLTDGMRGNFQLMKALGEYTRMNPATRIDRLVKFGRRINETEKSRETLTRFNVNMNRDLVRLTGRIMRPEQIQFGDNRSAAPDPRSADWTPALRNNKMYTNEDCKKWFFVYPRKTREDSDRFLKMMIEVATPLGFTMSNPKIIELNDDRADTYSKEITACAAKDPKFIMCVLMGNPQSNGERYTAIKKITTCQNAIPSQCIVHKTMQPKKGNMAGIRSIATKVVLQINCKLGGRPWMIGMPMKGVMVCGFDVSHNTVSRLGESYGAFVATMDLQKSNKFFSSVARHLQGEEVANTMKLHMQKAIYAYTKELGALPERIIMYRDGVSEGELKTVVEHEVVAINDMLKNMYSEKGGQVKFAYLIVNKRINTKFFVNRGGNYENPVPGTIIDDVVTLPERYDFYLISQSVRQGTVSPTSYNIVYDTFGLGPDKQQMLAYKMCHLYYNWCGTTRVPCVVQYAHKLSVLVGEYLRQLPNTGLNEKLYFL